MGFEGVGNCLKYLKRGWNRKEGRGNKDFKKGEQAGSRVGALKRGVGTGSPYKLWSLYFLLTKRHQVFSGIAKNCPNFVLLK